MAVPDIIYGDTQPLAGGGLTGGPLTCSRLKTISAPRRSGPRQGVTPSRTRPCLLAGRRCWSANRRGSPRFSEAFAPLLSPRSSAPPLAVGPAFLWAERLGSSFPRYPFLQPDSTAASFAMGLLPARAPRSTPLASSLRSCSSAPLRGAPAGQRLNAPLGRAGMAAPRSRNRAASASKRKDIL
jgi:hypothetical protein